MSALPHPGPPAKNQKNQAHGFTLLEVMVALALIAIAFTAMLSSQARNVTLAAESKFQTTAPLLAQAIMARYATEGRAAGGSEQGDWDSDFPDYRWQVQSTPVAMGVDPDLQGLSQVEVTVSWQEQPNYTFRLLGYFFTPPATP